MNRDEISNDNWPSVFDENLDEEQKKVFLNRKNAIDAVIKGVEPVDKICERYNIVRSEIYRLLDRCLTLNEQGLPYGYAALIPYKRLNMYQRTEQINGFEEEKAKVTLTGAFEKLLMLYPQLDELIKNLVFSKRKGDLESIYKRPKDIHKKFLEECKKLGISPEKGEYPFNTKDMARRSTYRYIKLLKERNPKSSVKDFGESSTTLFNTTGIGDKNSIIERPFERVELDGHKLDVSLAIKYTTLEGDEVVKELDRIWLLAIIDCATTVILGWHICLEKEYSTLDILTCYKNALFPHQAPVFTITGLIVPDSGFHSQKIPEAKFAIWDEISMDNAKPNRSKLLKEKTKHILNARLNYGPVGTPTRRPLIEKFFHLLEENGFYRLISTTGSNPKDPRKNKPGEKAVKYEITPDEIEQLVEVLIAQINNTPKKSLNGLTPLQVMEQRINRKMPFRTLDEEHRDGIEFTTIQETRVVRGNMKSGRRPYIHFEGVDYRNEILSENYTLVNTKLTLKINVEDLRVVFAYLPDGSELGFLKAQGKWGIRQHTLKVRKTINKLANRGDIN